MARDPMTDEQRETHLAPLRNILALATTYRSQETHLDHYSGCETNKRKPALYGDCDCGYEERRAETLIYTAERLVAAILD